MYSIIKVTVFLSEFVAPSGRAAAYGSEGRVSMDFSSLGSITLNWEFVSSLLSIIFINIILSGDNAVLIAMAVRSLPRDQRKKGIIFGSAVAVVLRVILTFFAAQLLQVSFIKLVGGLLVAWIAVKLFTEEGHDSELEKEGTTFLQALKIIIIADLVMSLDNVLAVAAASNGNFFLLMFGLVSSIPLVVGTSTLFSSLLDRYPIIIYIGAAILGKVGGEMVITDPYVVGLLNPGRMMVYSVEALFVVGVVVIGRLLLRRRRAEMQKEIDAQRAV